MWQLKNDIQAKVEPSIKQILPSCQLACPINEDIQRTNVLISLLPDNAEQAKEGIIQIGDYLYETNPLFTICGYVCGLCELECNYKTKGGAVRRRLLKRFLSDTYTPYLSEKKAIENKKDKEKVAVIGGGPGGLMCAWELSKKGYDVTIFDSSPKLGGAMRYIPSYRLSREVIDDAVNNLVRIGNIKVENNVKINANTLVELKEKGYKAFFVAIGTHYPRPLTFSRKEICGQDLEGVEYGLALLREVDKGNIPLDYFKGKKVVVIGGGNVAFDVARTARRIGSEKVTLVCLENADKTSKDKIPADIEEIEGGEQEGVEVIYSRGVREIIGENGKFLKIECPKCISVFDDKRFNPRFDVSDCIEIEGDTLLITIGQMSERVFFQDAGLLSEEGRLAVDSLTLQSLNKENVFIGGDARKIGFMADAMKEGIKAAKSINGYLRGIDFKQIAINYEVSEMPTKRNYEVQPELKWKTPEDRINFELFEMGFTLDEARKEARRCLTCGPCTSCKACVSAGIVDSLPTINIKEELCSGCGMCILTCNYDAAHLKAQDGKQISVTDLLKCKACGMCVSACPSGARELTPDMPDTWKQVVDSGPKIVCFSCKFGWGYLENPLKSSIKNWIPINCIGRIDITHIFKAFEEGANGVLLLGCAEKNCHFQDGDYEAKKKVYLAQKVLESLGIRKERLKMILSFDPSGEKIEELIDDFAKELDKIKENEVINNEVVFS